MCSLLTVPYWERVVLFAGFFILHELLESLHSEDPFALHAAFENRRAVNYRHSYVGLSY